MPFFNLFDFWCVWVYYSLYKEKLMHRKDYSPGPLCVPVSKIYGLGVGLSKLEEENAEEKRSKKKKLFGLICKKCEREKEC